MHQFTLQQGFSRGLEPFPYIKEFVLRKVSTIQLDSFVVSSSESLRIYCVMDGKYEWIINNQHYTLYPGDVAVVLPGQSVGGSKGYLDVGTLVWIDINIESAPSNDRLILGSWSNLNEGEQQSVGKILWLNHMTVLRMKETMDVLHEIHGEIQHQEIGYLTRVNHLIDSLLISLARQFTRQASSRRDFPRTFMKLEQALRQSLSHHWTVEEMAAMVGLGTTAFTEKVKSYTGFSPLNYLINIRISEAIKLLKRADTSVTSIALETGFYSSQHFSTTFKKLTGYTPGEFRKRNNVKK